MAIMTRKAKWLHGMKAIVVRNLFPSRIASDLLTHSYFSDFSFADLDNKKSYFITGAVGSGKTTLACKLLLDIAEREYLLNKPVLGITAFWSVPTLLQDIRACYNSDDRGQEISLIDSLIKTPWIVLDDLGAEKTTEWVLQTLYLVINSRYDAERGTIITSNLSLDELAEKLGDRIASRIAGMSEIITMSDIDYRLG